MNIFPGAAELLPAFSEPKTAFTNREL
jgi:hypothetical protein